MTKSDFIKILEKQAQTYRNYGDNVLADELDFVIEIANGLNKKEMSQAKQTIKAGDYVYIPTYSRKALRVITNPESNVRPLRVLINDDTFIDLQENGLSSKYHIEPIAFLATPENKAKIEQFYGCELESPTTRMATLSIPHYNS